MTKRLFSYRQGDLAEGLGVELLRQVALVAEVPRQEDVGLDAVATLLRRDGRFLHAQHSFWVQLKSRPASPPLVLEWDAEKTRWYAEQRLPIFVGEVSRNPLELRLFSLNSLDIVSHQVEITERLGMLRLDLGDDELPKDVSAANALERKIGPPIVTLRAADIDVRDETERIGRVLSRWVEVEALNVQLRLSDSKLHVCNWDEMEGPTAFQLAVSGSRWWRRVDLLNMLVPLLRLEWLANAALTSGDAAPRDAVNTLREWLKSEGIGREAVAELALRPERLYEVLPSLKDRIKIT